MNINRWRGGGGGGGWSSGAVRVAAAGALLAGGVLAATVPAIVRADDAPSRGPAGSSDRLREQLKWEQKLVFYGEEDTGDWSLRIYDKSVTEKAKVKYLELWKYDVDSKTWIKVDDSVAVANVVMPADKPNNAPADTQIIANLPIQPNTVGIYYAKFRVNDSIDGGSYCKIGPGLVGRAAKEAEEHLLRPPAGYIVADVPLTISSAKRMIIPDPRSHCGQTAKATPKSKPS